jgi:zinc transporter ZupT
VLVGVAVFWVLPEMAEMLRWPVALAWLAAGAALLWAVDRFIHPICPACSPQDHHHDQHDAAGLPGDGLPGDVLPGDGLHGYAAPLLIAAAVHAALDGWSAAAANGSSINASGGASRLSDAFVLAIAVHKVPEGLALGLIVRAALASKRSAFFWCSAAELATLAGAGFEMLLAPYIGPHILQIVLAAAGGSFLFLGAHAVQGEWRQRGITAAFVPALAGLASPTVLRLLKIAG